MSKKPQKNQNNPKKPQIVDQQNQPFLRTIFKRVRNINKKITEIDDLKKRGEQLKPEQIEKINRKAQYEQQRSRLENIADFFRQVYAQNTEHYRNNQLQQLDNLAQAVAVLRSNTNFKEADKLTQLNRALTQQSNLSVAESTKSVSQVLRRFAADYKLKKSLAAFVGQVQPQQQQQQKPQPVVVKEEPVQELKVQQPVKPVVPEVVVAQQPVKQQVPVHEPKVQEQPQQAVSQAQEVVAQQKQQGQQPAQNGGDRSRGNYRGNRGGYNRNRGPRVQGQQGGYRKEGGERRRYDNQNGDRRQRPNYKPKDNQPQQANQDSDSDSSLQEQVARDFKREEVKDLVEQGFTVVGKPKPKAKEGQKQWHEHTHGRKDHHGHQKRNY